MATIASVLAFLLAVTVSSGVWAMEGHMKFDNYKNSPTSQFVRGSGIMTGHDEEAPAEFDTQPTHVVDTPPAPMGCRTQDISITQQQVTDVYSGIPRFDVSIANTCNDRKCSIQKIIVFCGQFTTATPINPNVFRRVGGGPNCIVNNLQPMTSGQIITFRYDTEFMEPIRLSSAEPVCSQ